MNHTKVFALFRNNVSYIDPLLEEFDKSDNIDLMVAFSVRKPGSTAHLQRVNHVFLSGSLNEKFYEANDYMIIQPDVLDNIKAFNPDVILLATSYYSPTTWIVVRYAHRHRIPIVTRMTVEGKKNRNKIVRIIKRIIVGSYCRAVTAGVYECDNQRRYMIDYGIKKEALFFAPCVDCQVKLTHFYT